MVELNDFDLDAGGMPPVKNLFLTSLDDVDKLWKGIKSLGKGKKKDLDGEEKNDPESPQWSSVTDDILIHCFTYVVVVVVPFSVFVAV